MISLSKAVFFLVIAYTFVGHASATGDTHEGKIFPFESGDRFTWVLPAGEYFIIVHAAPGGNGVDLDVQGMGPTYAQPELHIRSYGTHGSAIQVEEGATRTLRVLNGSGQLVLARTDLVRDLPSDGPPAMLATAGSLEAGECKTYIYDHSKMSEMTSIKAWGNGVRLTTLTFGLRELHQAEGVLEVTVDPNEEASTVIQACNPAADGPKTFSIETRYPAESPAPATAAIPGVPSVAFLLVATGALLLRRR